MGPYILTKFQIDTTLLTPSKKVVTERASELLARYGASLQFYYLDFFLIYRIEVKTQSLYLEIFLYKQ
jgi:hypothetical protein